VRVAVAEPDEFVAAVLMQCVDDTSLVATRVADETALEDVARAHAADVVVVGPSLAEPGRARTVARLLAGGTRTLVVARHVEHEAALPLLLAGASGLVFIDDASGEDIRRAVLSVGSGTTALHPSVIAAVLDRWRAGRAEPAAAPVATPAAPAEIVLTAREAEVLEGLNEGLSNRLLAARLGVAEKTVEAHKSRLYAKLGARNQAHAVRIALDRGLLGAAPTADADADADADA
jgi:DNA-binding NarL/FixJ family response regulator